MKTFLLAGAGLAVLLALPADAQQRPDGQPPGAMRGGMGAGVDRMIEARFAEMDADHDGAITRDEYTAYRAKMWSDREARRAAMRDRAFARLDTNHDGSISKQEFNAAPPGGPGGKMGGIADHRPPPPPEGMAPGMMPPPGGAGGMAPPPGGPDGRGPPPGGPGRMRGPGRMSDAMSDRWFDRADTNHDGKVTLAEAKAATHAMMARRPMRGDRGGPGDDMPPPPPR